MKLKKAIENKPKHHKQDEGHYLAGESNGF